MTYFPARRALRHLQFIMDHDAASATSLLRFFTWQVRCLARQPAIVDFNTFGVRVYCPPEWRGGAPLTYIFREWHEPELAALGRFVGDGDNVIDAGANFGTYTVCLASLVGPSGHVLAVEAASHAIEILRQNVELNKADNVDIKHAALGDREGLVKFGIAPDPSRSSLVTHSRRTEDVQMTQLDNLADHRPVRFIKIDVEGAETLVVRGAEDMLREDKPIIQFESMPCAATLYGYEPNALWDKLVGQLGYTVVAGAQLSPMAAMPDGLVNLYAIHPDGPQPRKDTRSDIAHTQAGSPGWKRLGVTTDRPALDAEGALSVGPLIALSGR